MTAFEPALLAVLYTGVLTALKLAFLAVLYLFVYRVAKSVVVDMRSPRTSPTSLPDAGGVPPVGAAAPSPVRRKGKSPGQIVLLDGRGKRLRSIKLLGTVQIGRADACHIKLPDTYVSQFHARVFPQDGTWFVEDLGSTNGTFLNQRKVTVPSEVRAGDQVRVGTTTMELRA
jgi:pSer/pThr/pTyr-binding forkhead associated (FHA) protein